MSDRQSGVRALGVQSRSRSHAALASVIFPLPLALTTYTEMASYESICQTLFTSRAFGFFLVDARILCGPNIMNYGSNLL
jgi:hypothetical protein